MLKYPLLIYSESILEQPKAPPPIDETPLPIESVESPVQPENASTPIEVTPSPIVTELRLVQPLKAPPDIVALFMVTDVMELQLLKAPSPR